jgi:hypothetical protein
MIRWNLTPHRGEADNNCAAAELQSVEVRKGLLLYFQRTIELPMMLKLGARPKVADLLHTASQYSIRD